MNLRPEHDRDGQPLPPVLYCKKCDRPDQNLSLRAMRQCQPGTVGYYKHMSGWSPEPCQCDEPEWEK